MAYHADQHINLIMSKSFCSHDVHEDESTREHVLNAYKFLSSTPMLSVILMIVASSTKVKSVFDFNRDSVHVADPTVRSNTKGMFYLSGRVIIGAKQLLNESTKSEVYATLAHEFCHYAMDLTYGNFAKPYAKNDNKTKQEFEEISQKCQAHPGVEEYIDIVFEDYPPEMHHAELIVRVPHLIALYSDEPERLMEVRQTFIELFKFFETKILKEMQEALPKINEHDQLSEKEQKILKLRKIAWVLFLFTLAAISVVMSLIFFLNQHQVYCYSSLSVPNKLKIQNSTMFYKNIEVRFNELFPDNSTAYYKLTSDHITMILDGQALNFSNSHFLYLNDLIHHDWDNLAGKLKQKFLTSNFTFQGETLKFEKLSEISQDVFKSLSSKDIVDVLDGKELKVGNVIEDEAESYIERRFVGEDVEVMYEMYRVENKDDEDDKDEGLMVEMENGIEGSLGVVEMVGKVEENNDKLRGNMETEDGHLSLNSQESGNLSQTTESIGQKSENFSQKSENFDQNSENSENFDRMTENSSQKVEDLGQESDNSQLESQKTENLSEKIEIKVQSLQTSQQVIEQALKDRIFILNSDVGAGRTSIFRKFTFRIKKSFPTRWVSFIDLKNTNIIDNLHEFYDKLSNSDENSHLEAFLCQILELNSKNKFETEMFKEFLKLSNIVLLWDNFDKMSQKNREIMTKVFQLIHKFTKNVQFISTIPLFSSQLSQSLDAQAYELAPLTDPEQEQYLKNRFKLQNLSNEKIENFTQGAFKIAKTLQLDSPLMLKFIAEIYESDRLYDNPNFYEICHKFADKVIDKWGSSESGAKITNMLFSVSNHDFSLPKVYQKIAFDLNLRKNLTNSELKRFNNLKILKLNIPKSLTTEDMARMGILSYKSETDYKFLHETIADYFFANYFIDNFCPLDKNVSETEQELRNEVFSYLMTNYERKDMILTLIRAYVEDKDNCNQDFMIMLSQF
ncbi:uncharacterized protein [Chironomus tepperi]